MTHRGDLLRDAIALIEKDRNNQYGDPTKHMALSANLIAAFDAYPSKLSPPARHALHMALEKFARIALNPLHRDSYADVCGYTAIALEAMLHTCDGPHNVSS